MGNLKRGWVTPDRGNVINRLRGKIWANILGKQYKVNIAEDGAKELVRVLGTGPRGHDKEYEFFLWVGTGAGWQGTA